jgi:hypothetical protein
MPVPLARGRAATVRVARAVADPLPLATHRCYPATANPPLTLLL